MKMTTSSSSSALDELLQDSRLCYTHFGISLTLAEINDDGSDLEVPLSEDDNEDDDSKFCCTCELSLQPSKVMSCNACKYNYGNKFYLQVHKMNLESLP